MERDVPRATMPTWSEAFPGFTRANVTTRLVREAPDAVLVHHSHPVVWMLRHNAEHFHDALPRDAEGYVLVSERAFALCARATRHSLLPKSAHMRAVASAHGYEVAKDRLERRCCPWGGWPL